MSKNELNSQNSGRKPSNEVDVCGPKSGETGRPSIKRSGIDPCNPVFDAIDRMFAATLSANESKATIDALRPDVEKAVRELIRQKGLPNTFIGFIEYHGFKIRVQRPVSYTWEQNTQIQDDNIAYYKCLHGCYEQLQSDVKELRADMKRTAEKLAKAHPASESIKFGFTIALMP